ncbi:MAG: PaaI family thioesterase [Gemmatimonadaceae bacterium]
MTIESSNAWTPRDPAYETRVRGSFGRQSHMATLGASIAFIAPGRVHFALPFAPQFCQQNGFLHAGAITSVADSANGYAALTLSPPGTDVLAVEFKINLLEPAKGEGFLACGEVLRAGRTLTVCRADVFTTGSSERVLIATMLSTIIVRPIERSFPA